MKRAIVRAGGDAHDLCDLGGRFCAAGDALVGRGFARSHRRGVAVAAGIAAAAAVGARKALAHGSLLGVYLHMEDLGGDSQQRAEHGAHHAENENRKKNGVHRSLLPSQKICMPLKPMNASATRAAETRQIGNPSKHSGYSENSTLSRTEAKRTIASRKPMPPVMP